MFNQVLDQVLRIDRVFRQPQGHLLLIGLSGTGKATLCRFVSWLNQISFFQLKVEHFVFLTIEVLKRFRLGSQQIHGS